MHKLKFQKSIWNLNDIKNLLILKEPLVNKIHKKKYRIQIVSLLLLHC